MLRHQNLILSSMSASKQPSSSSSAAPLGRKRNGGTQQVLASGANTVLLSKRRKLGSGVPRAVACTSPSTAAELAESAVDSAPASSSAVNTDVVQDATFITDVIEAYAADTFFAMRVTAGTSLTEGLWWKEGRVVTPNSAGIKRLVLKAMHDHPLAGHLAVTKTIKAIDNRFFWRNAHQQVCDHIRHCCRCQLQTSNTSKPTALLQPLDVPPFAWHTVITDLITGLPVTADGHNATAVFIDKLIKYVYAVPCTDTFDAVEWAACCPA